MNVFGIGLPEMAVIAAIALLVFGPKRLPELGKTLGRTLKGFQSASQGFEEQFRSALDAAPEPPQPAATGSGSPGLGAARTAPIAAAADPPVADGSESAAAMASVPENALCGTSPSASTGSRSAESPAGIDVAPSQPPSAGATSAG